MKLIQSPRQIVVFRTYDAQGRPKILRTKPTLDGADKPTNAGGSLTTWNYHTQRGFLLNKRDADGKGADYTYTVAGRLLTRDWERGVTTTYGYDAGMLETFLGSVPATKQK